MSDIIINTPDGPVHFPDTMTDAQIEAALHSHYGKPNTYDEATIAAQGAAKRSEGVNVDGSIPGYEGNLDPSKAGDNWTTIGVAKNGLNLTYAVPSKPSDTPEMLGARLAKDGKHYGAFETDKAGADYMKSKAKSFILKDPTASPSDQETTPFNTKPTSQALGFVEGAKRPFNNAARYVEGGLKGMGVPTDRINNFFGTPSADQAKAADEAMFAEREKTETPGTFGRIGGNVVADIPIMAATRNPLLIGGASGTLNSEAGTAQGVASDAGIGAVMGKVGDTAIRSAGAVISPVWRDSVNRMLRSGVPLTPGQMMGGTFHRFEDAMRSSPVMGDMIAGAQNRGMVGFNRGMVNDALEPLEDLRRQVAPNAPSILVPENVRDGFAAIRHGQDVLGRVYDAVSPHLNVQADAVWNQEVGNLQRLTRHMPADYRDMFDRVLNEEVLGRMGPNGTMTGDTLREAKEIMNNEIKDFSKGDPHARRYANAILELRHQMMDMAARQNPGAAQVLRATDAGYTQLAIAQRSVAPAVKGVATPNNLRAASLVEDTTKRRSASARGEAHMRDYAEAGADTLSPTLNDSGTATRILANGLFGLGVGGASYAAPAAAASLLNPWTAAIAGTAMLPYTRVGGNAVRAAMSPRPGAMPVRRALQSVAPYGAAAASSTTHVVGDE